MSAFLIDGILWATVVALAAMTWRRSRPVFTAAVRGGTMDFLNVIPRIALGVGSVRDTSRRSFPPKSSPAGSVLTAAGSAF